VFRIGGYLKWDKDPDPCCGHHGPWSRRRGAAPEVAMDELNLDCGIVLLSLVCVDCLND